MKHKVFPGLDYPLGITGTVPRAYDILGPKKE
jgi:hypothetical protein